MTSCLGSASAEAFVTLRVLEGSHVIASNRRSLGRAALAFFGTAGSFASGRSLALECLVDNPPANLTLVVEFEGAVGVFGLAGTRVVMNGRAPQFTIVSQF